MSKDLSRKVIKKYSISYNEAQSMGITDNDLKYIYEISKNKFRVSVPDPFGKRRTKVMHNILDAIKLKYEYEREINEIKKNRKEENLSINENRKSITSFSTVAEGIEVYIKERKKAFERGLIQESTYEGDICDFKYNNYLKNSKIFDEQIGKVDVDRAQKFIYYLYDIKKKDGKMISTTTMHNQFIFINKIFNYFKKIKIIKENPFDSVIDKPKREISNDSNYLEDIEMHYVHEKIEFENIRLRTLVIIMLDMGLRKEEALALKYSDFNKIRNTVKVSISVIRSRLSGKIIVKKLKTRPSEREIIVTKHVLELINNMKTFKEACGFKVTKDDYIFTAWDSMRLISPDRYAREFATFMKKNENITQIPLKNLRATNTTFFASKGYNLKALQKRVGHSDFDTTAKYYIKSNFSEDQKLVDAYEEEFYNKLGLSVVDLYKIVNNRLNDDKKLINILEKVCNTFIDDSNFELELDRCQKYFRSLFPVFDKISKIDSLLSDDDLDTLLMGYKSKYLNIKIEPLEPIIKI